MDVANLRVKVGYDGAEAEAGLRKLGDTADKSGGFLSNAASSMVGFIGAQAVFPALAGAASFVGSSMIGMSSKLEMAQIGFTNMLGSSEAATAHLEELKKFAATSPFEFADVQAGSQRLLAMGINAKDVVPTLTSVGNAVAAMGGGKEQIDRVTMAIGQMNAKGKVSAEEMGQLAEAGIPAWDMLATSIGKSIPETQKLVSEGKIQADTFREAFNEEVPKRFGDAMAAQSQTLPGLMSTLKDTLQMGLAGMAGPLNDNLKQAMTGLSTSLGPLMEALGKAFGPLLGSVGETINMLAQQLTPIFTALAPIIGDTVTMLADSVGEILQALVPVLGKLLVSIGPILPKIAELAGLFVSSLLPAIMPLIDALLIVVQAFMDGLMPVFDQIKPLIPQMVSAFMPLVLVLADLLVQLAPLIGPMIQLNFIWLKAYPLIIPIIEAIANLAAMLISFLMPAITAIVGWLAEFVGAIANLDFGKVGEMIADIGSKIWGFITGIAGTIATKMKEAALALVNWIKEAIPFLITKWAEFEMALFNFIKGIPWQIGVAIRDWIPAIVGWLAEAVPALFEKWLDFEKALFSFIIGLPGKIVEWVKQLVPAIWDWVNNARDMATGKLGEIASGIYSWVTGLPGQIKTWASGMWSGFSDAFSGMLDTIRQLWNDLHIPSFTIGGWSTPFGDLPKWTTPQIEFPDIPAFAKGGYVSDPMLAIVGDTVGQGEIIAPESAMALAVSRGIAASGGGGVTIQNVNITNPDPEGVVRALRRWVDSNGPVPIRVQTSALGI